MYTKKRPPLKNEVTTRQGYDDPCCNTPLFQERDELFKRRRLEDNCDVVFESKDSN